jgi:hypothetical protein
LTTVGQNSAAEGDELAREYYSKMARKFYQYRNKKKD